MRYLRSALSGAVVALSAAGVQAHEFWIDPLAYAVPAGDAVVADILVGEEFSGSAYSYIPAKFRLADVIAGGKRGPVEGRIGDRPALRAESLPEGLVTLVYASTDTRLRWDTYEQFTDFLQHKAAGWAIAAHDDRGFPRADVTEAYSRYAKALVAVGNGAGGDADRGLATEIVALANPYTDDVTGGLPVRVLYRGEPRPGAQVEVFARDAAGAVEVSTVTADDAGIAIVPVRPGMEYLLDSVVVRAPEGEALTLDTMWETLWASLTFAVPDPG